MLLNRGQRDSFASVLLLVSSVLGAVALMLYRPEYWKAGVLVGCYGLSWLLLIRGSESRLFDADRLYFGVFGAYAVIPYVIAAVFPERLDPTTLTGTTLACILMGMIGVVAGGRSGLCRRIGSLDLGLDGDWGPRESTAVIVGLVGVGVFLVALLINKIGLATYFYSDYSEAYSAESGYGYLSVGLFLIETALIVYVVARSEHGKRMKWPALLLFAAFSLVILRTGRRRTVLELGLALMAVMQLYCKPIRLRTITLALAAMALVFTVVGQARSSLAEGLAGMSAFVREDFGAQQLWHVVDEPASFSMTLSETTLMVPSQQPYRYGMSYLEAFEILLPLKVHPNRPLSSAQWFVWMFDPRQAAVGGGYSYSLIAEGYLNFGIVGPLLICYLQSAFLQGIAQLRRANPYSKSRLLLYAVTFTGLVGFVRGDSASWVKATFVSMLLPAVFAAKFLGRTRDMKGPGPLLAPAVRVRVRGTTTNA